MAGGIGVGGRVGRGVWRGGDSVGGSVPHGEQRPLVGALPSARHTCRHTCGHTCGGRLGPASPPAGAGAGPAGGRRSTHPRPRPRSPVCSGAAFPPAVAKVTMTSPRPPGSECSGGGGRCQETPAGAPPGAGSRGRLRLPTPGRAVPARLAPSLPGGSRRMPGSGPHPRRGSARRPGASSLPGHCLCPEFVHQPPPLLPSSHLGPPSIPPFADHYHNLLSGLSFRRLSVLTVCHPLGSQSSYQTLTRPSHPGMIPSTGFPARSA